MVDKVALLKQVEMLEDGNMRQAALIGQQTERIETLEEECKELAHILIDLMHRGILPPDDVDKIKEHIAHYFSD